MVPFNNEGEEEEEGGEYEYSNLVVVVVVILVVKLVVIVQQKACVIKTLRCVCVCVFWRIKVCVVFPSFCKEQNRQKKKKILFVGKKI